MISINDKFYKWAFGNSYKDGDLMSKVDRFVEEIKRILKKDTRGLTIQEISKLLKTSRITASLALMKLEGMGLLDIRVIGNCRLHYLKNEIKGGRK